MSSSSSSTTSSTQPPPPPPPLSMAQLEAKFASNPSAYKENKLLAKMAAAKANEVRTVEHLEIAKYCEQASKKFHDCVYKVATRDKKAAVNYFAYACTLDEEHADLMSCLAYRQVRLNEAAREVVQLHTPVVSLNDTGTPSVTFQTIMDVIGVSKTVMEHEEKLTAEVNDFKRRVMAEAAAAAKPTTTESPEVVPVTLPKWLLSRLEQAKKDSSDDDVKIPPLVIKGGVEPKTPDDLSEDILEAFERRFGNKKKEGRFWE